MTINKISARKNLIEPAKLLCKGLLESYYKNNAKHLIKLNERGSSRASVLGIL